MPRKPFGQLSEDARDFRGFILGELHEPVVELDGFKRLDENRLARGAGGVHDALHLPPFGRAHRNDEAIVAQRDVVFAGVAAARAQHALAAFSESSRACAPCCARMRLSSGRSIVADFAVRQHGAANRHGQRAQIRNGGSPRGEKRKFSGRGTGVAAATFAKSFAQHGRRVRKRHRIKQHGRREHGDRRFEFRKPSLRIGQRTEAHFAAVAPVGNGFRDQRKRGVERGAVGAKTQARQRRGVRARRSSGGAADSRSRSNSRMSSAVRDTFS